MTFEQWKKFVKAANYKLCDKFSDTDLKPEATPFIISACQDFIDEVRNVTEVYEMENTKK